MYVLIHTYKTDERMSDCFRSGDPPIRLCLRYFITLNTTLIINTENKSTKNNTESISVVGMEHYIQIHVYLHLVLRHAKPYRVQPWLHQVQKVSQGGSHKEHKRNIKYLRNIFLLWALVRWQLFYNILFEWMNLTTSL